MTVAGVVKIVAAARAELGVVCRVAEFRTVLVEVSTALLAKASPDRATAAALDAAAGLPDADVFDGTRAEPAPGAAPSPELSWFPPSSRDATMCSAPLPLRSGAKSS